MMFRTPIAMFGASMHVTGEQLGQLSGIAAVLRFPLPELEDGQDDDSDEVRDVNVNVGTVPIASELPIGCYIVMSSTHGLVCCLLSNRIHS